MKYLFIFLLMFNFTNSQITNDTTETLKKYSYLVYGQKNNKIHNGSGFFIKHKEIIYFVTARHVITGCRGDGNKIKFQPDIMNILDKDKESTYPINVIEIFEKCTCYPQNEELDVEIIRINSPWDLGLNTINAFIGVSMFDYDYFATWGFPFYNMVENNEYDIMKNPVLTSGKTPDFFMSRPFVDKTKTKEDNFNYLLNLKNITFNTNLEGASGSPVFLKNTNTNKWQIIGALIGAPNENSTEKYFIIARIEAILKKIEDLNK